ncbi:MAG TPA: type VI secretion system-associated FHA domain protein [Nannocystis sp.]
MQITVIDHKARRTVCERLFDVFPIRIGRDAANDVVLPFAFVSSWHAEVRSDGESLRLCDLGATNGLFIGPRRIAGGGAVPLTDRLVVTVGELELRLEVVRPDAPAEPAEADDLPRLPGASAPRGPVAASGSIDALPSFATDDTDFAARLARLQAALHELRPHHAQLEAARRAWDERLAHSVRALEASGDRQGVNMLLREFPARDRGGFVIAGATDPFAAVEEERSAVMQAASELLPGQRAPTGDDETRRFLTRIIDVLRVFAACTLELQHIRALQAEELGVTWADPNDPLAALATADEVLRYLLDWRDTGEKRSEELVRVFGGLVDHHRAYVRSALEAARSALAALAPTEIERGAVTGWPGRAAALWHHYESVYAALHSDTHDHLTPAFRATLQRAYTQALARAGIAHHKAT